MENFLMEIMEFIIELLVVTAGVWLVAVGLSLALLYPSGFYKARGAAIVTPLLLALAFGAAGAIGSGSLRVWMLFYLLAPALSVLTVSSHFRKRLRKLNQT